jgi:VWFA-related protein
VSRASLIAASVLLAAGAFAQQQVIRSESRLVLVDSIVTDRKGAYIPGLTRNNFKVWEDGKQQTISTFSTQANTAATEKRYLVLFFDDSSVPPATQVRARQAAAKFIDSNAGPNLLISVVDFGGGLRITQNFTSDVARLKRAVGEVRAYAGDTDEPLAGDARRRTANVPSAGNNSNGPMPAAVTEMAEGLADLNGRKTVVLFSSGLTGRHEQITAAAVACNRENIAVYPVDMGSSASASLAYAGTADSPVAPSRRQSYTPQGARGIPENEEVGSVPNPSEALYAIAKGTGGFVISRSDNLLADLDNVVSEQSAYYVLGYVPAKDADPGACHTIKVKVDRGGAAVRSRAGYCEAKPLGVLSGPPGQGGLEERLTSTAAPTVAASIQAPFFYTSADAARVFVAIEIPGAAIRFVKDKGRFEAKLDVVGIAYLQDGGVAAKFTDHVALSLNDKKQVDEFRSSPYHYEKQFQIAPGKFDLKVAFASDAGDFGRVETPLAVEPWDPGKFSLTGLALSKSMHAAKRPGLNIGERLPLIVNGMQLVPAGTNRLTKSDKAVIYVEIYEPSPAALNIRMILLDAKTGKPGKDTGMAPLNAQIEPGNPLVPVGLIVPVAELNPGSYTARITALDAAGRESTASIDFEVTP